MFVDLVDSEDVLNAVRTRGPMIPMDIRKFLGKGDSITIGAALSTLLSKNLIYSTTVKLGGSPFYYVRGQENKLELLNKYLNDKDKRVFEILREEKILKDTSLEPLFRVSLRNIPDFAKKVELSNQGETVLYWRWYLVREEDAINLIRGKLQKRDLSSNPSPFSAQQSQYSGNSHSSQSQNNNSSNSQSNAQMSARSNPQSTQQSNRQDNSQSSFSSDAASSSQSQNHARTNWQNDNQQSQVQSKAQVQSQNMTSQNQNQNKSLNQENSQELARDKGVGETKKSLNNNSKNSSVVSNQGEQKTIGEGVPDFDDDFFKQLKSFFAKNNIVIKQAELIRKNSDFEFVVELNTPFGATQYFCKAKSKKKCNEGDLSSAYLQGQNKRMPTVFITTGEITKKAKAKARDDYKGLLVKEL